MPKFAANLSMLYNEHEFLDRFAAAARDGFEAVEYLFPYGFSAGALSKRLADNGLAQVLFNAPPGDWLAGERGIACLPDREREFRDGFFNALEYAEALACPSIHVMAGLVPQGADLAALQTTYEGNLAWACEQASAHGRQVLIEPINLRDMPGFFLNYQAHAHRTVQSLGAKNLKVQMDLYHCQIMEGDLASKLQRYLPTGDVGHIQIAGVPMRNEPDIGELNYQYLFDLVDALSKENNWQGYVGCEYRPLRGNAACATSDGLEWFRGRAAERG
jgi:hydroxypyruvate isomerase